MSEYNFEIGDRIQHTDEDDDVTVGEIKSLFSKNEDDEIVEYANVLWDGKEEVESWELELLDHEEDEDELEAEFKAVVEAHMEEIEEQVEIAAQAIKKAEELSEKYGLPFRSSITPLSQSYHPASYSEKFSGLDYEFVANVTGAYSVYHNDGDGWEHSAVC